MSKNLITLIHVILGYGWILSVILIYINSKILPPVFNEGKITKITNGRFYETFHIDWE